MRSYLDYVLIFKLPGVASSKQAAFALSKVAEVDWNVERRLLRGE